MRKKRSLEITDLLSKLQKPAVLDKPVEWKGRRYRRAELAGDDKARKKAEQRSREKWAQRILEILVQSGMPFGCEYVSKGWGPSSPEALRCLRGLRPASLKKRATDIGPFLRYVWGVFGKRWPTDPSEILSYFAVKAEEGASRSIYRSVQLSIKYFEEAGEQVKDFRLAELDSIVGAMKEYESRKRADDADLGKTRRQAAPLLVKILGCLEKIVVDPSEKTYVRAYAWYRLLRHWASMRFDDGNGLNPDSLIARARGVFGTLSRTKTSGADKGLTTLPIYVSNEAYVDKDWLTVGLDIWKNELNFPRDYFLVLPNLDYSHHCGKRARYSDAQYLSKQLLSGLKDESGDALLIPQAVGFWTEHSDRTGLDSWLGALSVGADKRRFVGRWAAKGSEDTYVRTAVRIVENCQRLAAKHAKSEFRGGPDFLGEEETLHQLAVFLRDAGVDEQAIAEQCERLTSADFTLAPDPIVSMNSDGLLISQQLPLEEPSVSEVQHQAILDGNLGAAMSIADDADEVLEDELLKGQNLAKLLDSAEPEGQDEVMGFVVSITRGGRCRRLHFVGGCFRIPGEHYKNFEGFGQSVPEDHQYNLRCRDCFPAERPAVQKGERDEEGSDGGESTSGSSSSSSTAPAADAAASDS